MNLDCNSYFAVKQFVDLAALSMSGSLTPSIPVQVLLKYSPPKITIVYHFENKVNDQYYHDITFEQNMLENETVEDIVSHLYMSEAYYFNPKILKRHQVSQSLNHAQIIKSKLKLIVGTKSQFSFNFISKRNYSDLIII